MTNRRTFRHLVLSFLATGLLFSASAYAGPAYSRGVKSAVQKAVRNPNAKITFRSSKTKTYTNNLSRYVERRAGTFKATVNGKTVASGKLDFQVTKKNNVRLLAPKKTAATAATSTSSNSGTPTGTGHLNAEQYARSLQPGYRSGNTSTRASYLSNYGYSGRWGHGRYRTR